jgi:hypothetical protein
MRGIEKIVIDDLALNDLRELVKVEDDVEVQKSEIRTELKVVTESLQALLPVI